jgi:hypothetical protein
VLHQIKLTYGRRMLRLHQHPASGGLGLLEAYDTLHAEAPEPVPHCPRHDPLVMRVMSP